MCVPTTYKLISGPCSIEIMYPCEWRIAIPASLMRVEKRLPSARLLSFCCHQRDQKGYFSFGFKLLIKLAASTAFWDDSNLGLLIEPAAGTAPGRLDCRAPTQVGCQRSLPRREEFSKSTQVSCQRSPQMVEISSS